MSLLTALTAFTTFTMFTFNALTAFTFTALTSFTALTIFTTIRTYYSDIPYLVMVSVRVRNVMDTTTLDNQFVAVDSEFPVLLAHSG